MTKRKRRLIFAAVIIIVLVGGTLLTHPWEFYVAIQSEKAYEHWKKDYVVCVNEEMDRVIDPQSHNATVSEGIGYGMLFSATLGDSETFARLWRYAQNQLNQNGLMHWKIDTDGKVIGQGAASDADQDIAYALLLAAKRWPERNYHSEAVKMIKAIREKEISSAGLLLPGDQWGDAPPLNPSYISPAYYDSFKLASGDPGWTSISSANMQLLRQAAHEKTGFLPDWSNQDDQAREDHFGYDALRVPIRLLQYYNRTKDPLAADILQKQYNTLARIGFDHLTSGYTLSGEPVTSYLNTAYLASFTAIGGRHPYSASSFRLTNQLINTPADDYYGSSLKVWTLLIISGRL